MTCGSWGCILFESKEYTPRPPKKDSGRDGVVTSSISLASSLRIAYPSKTPPAPSSSFHRSSSSRCKHFVGLRREPFPFGHRLTHSAAPPLPTANAALTLRWEPYISPLTTPLKRPKAGGRGPFLWILSRSGTGKRFFGGAGKSFGAFGRTVGGGLCPAPGQGLRKRRGVRTLRCARGMEGESHQPTGRSCYTPCFSFRAARFAGAGGVGAGDGAAILLFPVIARSGATRRSVLLRPFWLVRRVRAAT